MERSTGTGPIRARISSGRACLGSNARLLLRSACRPRRRPRWSSTPAYVSMPTGTSASSSSRIPTRPTSAPSPSGCSTRSPAKTCSQLAAASRPPPWSSVERTRSNGSGPRGRRTTTPDLQRRVSFAARHFRRDLAWNEDFEGGRCLLLRPCRGRNGTLSRLSSSSSVPMARFVPQFARLDRHLASMASRSTSSSQPTTTSSMLHVSSSHECKLVTMLRLPKCCEPKRSPTPRELSSRRTPRWERARVEGGDVSPWSRAAALPTRMHEVTRDPSPATARLGSDRPTRDSMHRRAAFVDRLTLAPTSLARTSRWFASLTLLEVMSRARGDGLRVLSRLLLTSFLWPSIPTDADKTSMSRVEWALRGYARSEAVHSRRGSCIDAGDRAHRAAVSFAGPSTRWTGCVIRGRYRVLGVIGSGGMGAVYEAVDLQTGCKVALKALQPGAQSPQQLKRLSSRGGRGSRDPKRSRMSGALPWCRPRTPFIVMERLHGETLRARLVAEGGLSLAVDAIAIACQLLDALAATHEAGVVHRDVKPSNVFLTSARDEAPRLKLIDFEVAKIVRGDGPDPVRPSVASSEEITGHASSTSRRSSSSHSPRSMRVLTSMRQA